MRATFKPSDLHHACGVTIHDATDADNGLIHAVISLSRNMFQNAHAYMQGNQEDWRFVEVWGDTDSQGEECAQWLAAELDGKSA